MQVSTESIVPVDLKSLLPQGCWLIDVREPVEYAAGHIDGARLIPLGQIERRSSEIDRNQSLVITCRSGARGAEAVRKLEAQGFTGVRNLEGGMLAWEAAGLPVTRSEKKSFPLMQQVQITIGIGVLTGVILSRAVHPNWIFFSAFFGAGLVFAGSTGWCGLAILMSKMPWNRVNGSSCCTSKL